MLMPRDWSEADLNDARGQVSLQSQLAQGALASDQLADGGRKEAGHLRCNQCFVRVYKGFIVLRYNALSLSDAAGWERSVQVATTASDVSSTGQDRRTTCFYRTYRAVHIYPPEVPNNM